MSTAIKWTAVILAGIIIGTHPQILVEAAHGLAAIISASTKSG